MAFTSLSTWIRQTYNNYTFSDHDPEWKRYVEDHRPHIVSTATVKNLGADDNELFRFRPREFLQNYQYDPDLLGIMLYINQLHSPTNFHDLKSILIPNAEYIAQLRSQFDSFKSNLNRAKI